MAGVTFDELENGHQYSTIEPDGSTIDTGRLYKIKNYNGSEDNYVKIIITRNEDGMPMHWELFGRVRPGTRFLEDLDPETDPEFPDKEDLDKVIFFNVTDDEDYDTIFKDKIINAFDKVEHPNGRGGKKQRSKKQRSKKQKSKKKRSKKTKKTRK